MSEEIKNLTLCTDHRKSFSRFDFFTERPCDYCALVEETERLSEIIFELEENLKAAQDQNHYFVLCGEWRDKYYQLLGYQTPTSFRDDFTGRSP